MSYHHASGYILNLIMNNAKILMNPPYKKTFNFLKPDGKAKASIVEPLTVLRIDRGKIHYWY